MIKVREKCPHVKNLILFDNIPEEKKARAIEIGYTIYHYDEVIEEGKK